MSGTRYVVRRLSWVPAYGGGHFHTAGADGEHSGVPVRAFADRDAAEVCRDWLEAEAHRQMHPGQMTPGDGLEDEQAVAWCKQVEAIGLTPPALTPYVDSPGYIETESILRWWAKHAPTAGLELRQAVWKTLPDVQFYDVVEVPLED